MRKDAWQPDDSQAVIDAYKSGMSARQLGLRYGVADVTITEFLRRDNIIIRNRSGAKRKYTLDENAFDTITPESAYWIGFLLADGNVYDSPGKSRQLNIGLKAGDAEHLEKFKQFLKCNKPLYYNRNAVFFSIYSDTICNALAKFGVVPRKSKIAKPPQELLDNRDFWRGMVDGDGWVGWTTANRPVIGLCGTPDIIKAFVSFVGKNNKIYYKNDKFAEVRYVCTSAKSILQILYSDAIVALNRKQQLFEEIKLWKPQYMQRRSLKNLVYN